MRPRYSRVMMAPGMGTRRSWVVRSVPVAVPDNASNFPRGGRILRSASRANSRARRLARSDNPPSSSSCNRQAIRFQRNWRLPDRLSSPNTWAYSSRSSPAVIRLSEATRFAVSGVTGPPWLTPCRLTLCPMTVLVGRTHQGDSRLTAQRKLAVVGRQQLGSWRVHRAGPAVTYRLGHPGNAMSLPWRVGSWVIGPPGSEAPTYYLPEDFGKCHPE